ncbi:MAG TPA: sulfite exporter TauE/SafE family protein [Candidatus Tyrphobacter sp.]|nr:sulfite exporter TauE/SafE family protein [Candidatus Tyrphobacter sp.]
MIYQVFLAGVSFLAGGVASLAGFGIGSFLTPLFALKTGTGLAIACVSVAHFSGTALRFGLLRKKINRKVLLSFGLMSALGGLIGALLHNFFYNAVLTDVFGGLLVFAGLVGLSGFSSRFRFSGIIAWFMGGLSGFFGGLVGNQGGIRSAALFGFDLNPQSFVATATGIALIVDIARLPVYLAVQWSAILAFWPLILIAILGVVIGTLAGGRLLQRIPEPVFKKFISVIFLLIGLFVLIRQ